jgi:hypothetical protein
VAVNTKYGHPGLRLVPWRHSTSPLEMFARCDRGSSDAEQLGEFGLGVGAERVPMIGRVRMCRSAERRPALRQSPARTRWRVRCPPGALSGLVWC